VERLVNLCKQDEEVQQMVKQEADDELYPEVGPEKGNEHSAESASDNITTKQRGDSESYVVRRLKRDHPEIRTA